MAKPSLNMSDLGRSLAATDTAEKLDLTPILASKLIEEFGAIISRALVEGRTVNFHRVGKFKVLRIPARRGRNPATGDVIPIPAQRRVHLAVANFLKEAMAEGELPAVVATKGSENELQRVLAQREAKSQRSAKTPTVVVVGTATPVLHHGTGDLADLPAASTPAVVTPAVVTPAAVTPAAAAPKVLLVDTPAAASVSAPPPAAVLPGEVVPSEPSTPIAPPAVAVPPPDKTLLRPQWRPRVNPVADKPLAAVPAVPTVQSDNPLDEL